MLPHELRERKTESRKAVLTFLLLLLLLAGWFRK